MKKISLRKILFIIGCFIIIGVGFKFANPEHSMQKQTNNIEQNVESVKSESDIVIEEARMSNSKKRFVEYLRDTNPEDKSIVKQDNLVKKWNQNLNQNSNDLKQLNDYIIKNNNDNKFASIHLGTDYELYSVVIPFALDIKYDENKYIDYKKIMQDGVVGIDNITVLGKTISSKHSLAPVNKQIILGKKPFIKIKDNSDYEPKNVENELKKLGLNPQIQIKDKPKDFTNSNNIVQYEQFVEKFEAPNLDKLKKSDKITVIINWERISDKEIKKTELEKFRKDALKVLKDSKDISAQDYDTYINIITQTKSVNTLKSAIKELNELNEKITQQKLNEQTNSSSSNSSSTPNSSPVNSDKPKDNNAQFGFPLSDMHITQDLHDGLSIDYQPSGCYLHPGCVPTFAIDGGTAHVNSGDAYGNSVVIEHSNGYCSRYAHLNSVSIAEGTHVSKGDVLGMVGTTGNSTGVHLHFEIRQGGGSCYGPMVNPHTYGM